jgi:hypothetical protein
MIRRAPLLNGTDGLGVRVMALCFLLSGRMQSGIARLGNKATIKNLRLSTIHEYRFLTAEVSPNELVL